MDTSYQGVAGHSARSPYLHMQGRWIASQTSLSSLGSYNSPYSDASSLTDGSSSVESTPRSSVDSLLDNTEAKAHFQPCQVAPKPRSPPLAVPSTKLPVAHADKPWFRRIDAAIHRWQSHFARHPVQRSAAAAPAPSSPSLSARSSEGRQAEEQYDKYFKEPFEEFSDIDSVENKPATADDWSPTALDEPVPSTQAHRRAEAPAAPSTYTTPSHGECNASALPSTAAAAVAAATPAALLPPAAGSDNELDDPTDGVNTDPNPDSLHGFSPAKEDEYVTKLECSSALDVLAMSSLASSEHVPAAFNGLDQASIPLHVGVVIPPTVDGPAAQVLPFGPEIALGFSNNTSTSPNNQSPDAAVRVAPEATVFSGFPGIYRAPNLTASERSGMALISTSGVTNNLSPCQSVGPALGGTHLPFANGLPTTTFLIPSTASTMGGGGQHPKPTYNGCVHVKLGSDVFLNASMTVNPDSFAEGIKVLVPPLSSVLEAFEDLLSFRPPCSSFGVCSTLKPDHGIVLAFELPGVTYIVPSDAVLDQVNRRPSPPFTDVGQVSLTVEQHTLTYIIPPGDLTHVSYVLRPSTASSVMQPRTEITTVPFHTPCPAPTTFEWLLRSFAPLQAPTDPLSAVPSASIPGERTPLKASLRGHNTHALRRSHASSTQTSKGKENKEPTGPNGVRPTRHSAKRRRDDKDESGSLRAPTRQRIHAEKESKFKAFARDFRALFVHNPEGWDKDLVVLVKMILDDKTEITKDSPKIGQGRKGPPSPKKDQQNLDKQHQQDNKYRAFGAASRAAHWLVQLSGPQMAKSSLLPQLIPLLKKYKTALLEMERICFSTKGNGRYLEWVRNKSGHGKLFPGGFASSPTPESHFVTLFKAGGWFANWTHASSSAPVFHLGTRVSEQI